MDVKATGKFCAGGTVDACQVVVMVVVIMVILVIMVAVVIKLIMLIGVVVVIMIEVVLYSVLLNMTSSPIRRTLGAPSCATIRADMNLWGSSAVGKGELPQEDSTPQQNINLNMVLRCGVYPGLYTEVSRYSDWIEVIEGDVKLCQL